VTEPSHTRTVEHDAPDPRSWGPAEGGERSAGFPPRPGPWGGPFERFADRMRELRGDPRAGIAALVLVALVAGLVWYRLGAGAAKKGERVTVHVAGAVAKPGVYDLGAGARVIDAIEAAGGGVPESDVNRLNLAAQVADGQRVLVQRVGEAAPAAPSTGGSSETDASAADSSGLVNLNAATQPQLEALPGIGPTLAKAIIAERERRGGFRSVNELRDVRGIGEKRFADLKDKVTI
jgi:competence protein ComEA